MNPINLTAPRLSRRRRAFTLIELLVVIVIIAVLAGISLPIYAVVTQRSRETVTLANMRQTGAAFLSYASDNNYVMPNQASPQAGQTQASNWPKLLQPYIQNVSCYVSPIPPYNNVSYQVTNPSLLVSDTINYTSYVANGFNDLGVSTSIPRLNNISLPRQTLLFGIGIPYPLKNQFYMNSDTTSAVLNRNSFSGSSAWVFSDGSSRILLYNATDPMNAAPKSAGYYTDWLWLVYKTNASSIH